MFYAMFHLDPSVMEKILRPLAIYTFLLIALRAGGQREIGQNNALQFVLLLSVANAVQNGIIGVDNSLTGAVIGAVTLFLIHGLVELIASRNSKIHRIVYGRPVELVNDGKLNSRTMRRQRLSTEDLLDAASTQGAMKLEEIERAFVNAKGEIVVIARSENDLVNQVAQLNSQVRELLAQIKTIKE
ncbi:MAG: DUF421 domain-containing protein [Actinobacteria bacterium]|jgi:uncharacterized membrane protein YcaP (DUF421 family)|nr:DUF421 domain-containing protein [Actinomycetota bacterium]